MKKSTRRRRKHCMQAVVRRSQKFRPLQTPFLRARDGQNLISWRWSLPFLPTNPVWWGLMHAILSYHGNRPTHTHTHPQTNRTGPITIHCAAASMQCNNLVVKPNSIKMLRHSHLEFVLFISTALLFCVNFASLDLLLLYCMCTMMSMPPWV